MAKWYYQKKYYKNWFIRKFIRISRKTVDFLDGFSDRKVCGISLSKFVPSMREGATGSQSTPYLVLDTVFQDAVFTAEDSLIDVGCGKGRVLAYLLKRKCPCKLSGIELNPEVAAIGQGWAEKYPNVNIMCGDAFQLDYNPYSIIYMGRPFEPELFLQFIEMLEQTLKHPIKLYYWVEQQSGHYLDDRRGWTLEKRDILFTRKGFFVAMTPQRYSIWTFTPYET